ncbi:helix-turn-helix domain-containing protein [Reichenbachiella sp.]|uniref:helix-turn-helix domain-containing protein n=1 Tax=Reichenbachiella sp. TaxID=2184521 RepID=UPI003BB08CDC
MKVEPDVVYLGGVTLSEGLSKKQQVELDLLLDQNGFERIGDEKSKLLENIKAIVIDNIHHQDHFNLNVKWSDFLAEQLNHDYHYLSTLFSSVTGITLEQYIIKQKIEKVKELLMYDQLSTKEIAFKLGYSSVAHLSAQFKKVTGMTPTVFKQSRQLNQRKSLDSLS